MDIESIIENQSFEFSTVAKRKTTNLLITKTTDRF